MTLSPLLRRYLELVVEDCRRHPAEHSEEEARPTEPTEPSTRKPRRKATSTGLKEDHQ